MESEFTKYCLNEKKVCVRWINYYFKDCVCDLNDMFSFGFGMLSLICWGVAEIPQIMTNFKNKSGHGVSLVFLCTWILGDIFNLVGCILEPTTLPTQLYTALLYTATTIVLVLQCIYYDYVHLWRKSLQKDTSKIRNDTNPLNRLPEDADYKLPHEITPMNVPNNHQRDFSYISARSLAGSATPPLECYLKAESAPLSALQHEACSSSDDEKTTSLLSVRRKPHRQPRSIPNLLGYGTFLATSFDFTCGSKGLTEKGHTKLSGRTLLHEHRELRQNVYGQWLGWGMAAIYMGGRIPQILLNIKRGNVEGLSPFMFVFALMGNATYVGSILMRSTEWDKIKANLPWLLDAIVCVALDFFIIAQYIYYRCFVQKTTRLQNHHQDNEETQKVVLSI